MTNLVKIKRKPFKSLVYSSKAKENNEFIVSNPHQINHFENLDLRKTQRVQLFEETGRENLIMFDL